MYGSHSTGMGTVLNCEAFTDAVPVPVRHMYAIQYTCCPTAEGLRTSAGQQRGALKGPYEEKGKHKLGRWLHSHSVPACGVVERALAKGRVASLRPTDCTQKVEQVIQADGRDALPPGRHR